MENKAELTEEDTTEGSEGRNENGRHSLSDARGLGDRAGALVEDYSTAWHDGLVLCGGDGGKDVG